jgi:hypothetical protein
MTDLLGAILDINGVLIIYLHVFNQAVATSSKNGNE